MDEGKRRSRMTPRLPLIALAAALFALAACSTEFGTTDVTGDAPADSALDTGTDVPADTPLEIPPDCGDGHPDPGEECDDGNDIDGDGCDRDCTWSCHGHGECDDGDACSEDLCTEDHVCVHEEVTCPPDDDPCTDDVCVPEDGCVHIPQPRWFRDGDDDGYGTPDDTVCGESPPSGYVDNDRDCCDLFPIVNPGITAWNVEPYTCGPVVSHDYNCDGVEEQRYRGTFSCTMVSGVCTVTEGWYGSVVPACGEMESWVSSCYVDTTGACAPGTATTQYQTCR
jgi:cysteine-rich repeat protein